MPMDFDDARLTDYALVAMIVDAPYAQSARRVFDPIDE